MKKNIFMFLLGLSGLVAMEGEKDPIGELFTKRDGTFLEVEYKKTQDQTKTFKLAKKIGSFESTTWTNLGNDLCQVSAATTLYLQEQKKKEPEGKKEKEAFEVYEFGTKAIAINTVRANSFADPKTEFSALSKKKQNLVCNLLRDKLSQITIGQLKGMNDLFVEEPIKKEINKLLETEYKKEKSDLQYFPSFASYVPVVNYLRANQEKIKLIFVVDFVCPDNGRNRREEIIWKYNQRENKFIEKDQNQNIDESTLIVRGYALRESAKDFIDWKIQFQTQDPFELLLMGATNEKQLFNEPFQYSGELGEMFMKYQEKARELKVEDLAPEKAQNWREIRITKDNQVFYGTLCVAAGLYQNPKEYQNK